MAVSDGLGSEGIGSGQIVKNMIVSGQVESSWITFKLDRVDIGLGPYWDQCTITFWVHPP